MTRRLLLAAMLCVAGMPAAASCLVAGDSIAVGTASILGGCARDAEVGIPSSDIVQRIRPGFDAVVISSGSNDALNPRLEPNLEAARARAPGSRWIWIVPRPRVAAAIVRAVAARHGDVAVAFQPGPDGVHPGSYPTLARSVLAVLARSSRRLSPSADR